MARGGNGLSWSCRFVSTTYHLHQASSLKQTAGPEIKHAYPRDASPDLKYQKRAKPPSLYTVIATTKTTVTQVMPCRALMRRATATTPAYSARAEDGEIRPLGIGRWGFSSLSSSMPVTWAIRMPSDGDGEMGKRRKADLVHYLG